MSMLLPSAHPRFSYRPRAGEDVITVGVMLGTGKVEECSMGVLALTDDLRLEIARKTGWPADMQHLKTYPEGVPLEEGVPLQVYIDRRHARPTFALSHSVWDSDCTLLAHIVRCEPRNHSTAAAIRPKVQLQFSTRIKLQPAQLSSAVRVAELSPDSFDTKVIEGKAAWDPVTRVLSWEPIADLRAFTRYRLYLTGPAYELQPKPGPVVKGRRRGNNPAYRRPDASATQVSAALSTSVSSGHTGPASTFITFETGGPSLYVMLKVPGSDTMQQISFPRGVRNEVALLDALLPVWRDFRVLYLRTVELQKAHTNAAHAATVITSSHNFGANGPKLIRDSKARAAPPAETTVHETPEQVADAELRGSRVQVVLVKDRFRAELRGARDVASLRDGDVLELHLTPLGTVSATKAHPK